MLYNSTRKVNGTRRKEGTPMMIICKSYNPNASMMDYARTIKEAVRLRDCVRDTAIAALAEGLTSAANDYEIDRFMMDNLGEHAERNKCPLFVYGEKDISLIREWMKYSENL